MVFQSEKERSWPGLSKECRTRKSPSRSTSVRVPYKSISSVSICILTSTRESKRSCGWDGIPEASDDAVSRANETWLTWFFVRHLAHCLLCDKWLEVLP